MCKLYKNSLLHIFLSFNTILYNYDFKERLYVSFDRILPKTNIEEVHELVLKILENLQDFELNKNKIKPENLNIEINYFLNNLFNLIINFHATLIPITSSNKYEDFTYLTNILESIISIYKQEFQNYKNPKINIIGLLFSEAKIRLETLINKL